MKVTDIMLVEFESATQTKPRLFFHGGVTRDQAKKLLSEVREFMVGRSKYDQIGGPGALYQAKYSWSQTAGCRCGCSPGFVVTGLPIRSDIHVTVTQ